MFYAYQGSNYFRAYINKLNTTDQNDESILYNKVLNNTFIPLLLLLRARQLTATNAPQP